MTWTVRSALPEDVDGWLDLHEAVASEGRWIATESPVDREAKRRAFLDRLANEAYESFVAVDGDRVIGDLGIGPIGRTPAYIGMEVDCEYRGQGVGSALMRACIDWAHERRVHKISLEMWPGNEAAAALYRKFGFVEEGVVHRHYRRNSGALWDAVVMGLVLDTDAPGGP